MALLELCHILQCGELAALKTMASAPCPSSKLSEKTLQELSLLQGTTFPPLSPPTPSQFTMGTWGDGGGGGGCWLDHPKKKVAGIQREVSRHQEVGR